jgi:hypothetical protein
MQRGPNSYSYAAIGNYVTAGSNQDNKDRRVMTKTFAFAVSAMVLAAISGQALAGSITSKAHPDTHAYTSRQAMNALAAIPTNAANTHRYHGGPKTND